MFWEWSAFMEVIIPSTQQCLVLKMYLYCCGELWLSDQWLQWLLFFFFFVCFTLCAWPFCSALILCELSLVVGYCCLSNYQGRFWCNWRLYSILIFVEVGFRIFVVMLTKRKVDSLCYQLLDFLFVAHTWFVFLGIPLCPTVFILLKNSTMNGSCSNVKKWKLFLYNCTQSMPPCTVLCYASFGCISLPSCRDFSGG